MSFVTYRCGPFIYSLDRPACVSMDALLYSVVSLPLFKWQYNQVLVQAKQGKGEKTLVTENRLWQCYCVKMNTRNVKVIAPQPTWP